MIDGLELAPYDVLRGGEGGLLSACISGGVSTALHLLGLELFLLVLFDTTHKMYRFYLPHSTKKVGRADAARASGAYIPGMAPPDANKPSKNAKKQVFVGRSYPSRLFGTWMPSHYL